MYITYTDITLRYPIIESWGLTESHVNSHLIYYAEKELDSELATAFTVPFSDTTLPIIKDLAIDTCYYRTIITKDPDKVKAFKEELDRRISRLVSGQDKIIALDGTVIEPGSSTQEVWSTTEDYHPVHSMLGAEDSLIDPDRLDAEIAERR